jgi:glycosyltransferase involved in cell wall biosynthesis
LAILGHEVTILGHPFMQGSTVFTTGSSNLSPQYIYESYENAIKRPDAYACDILIVSRQADMINHVPIQARKKILWIHDVHAGEPSEQIQRALEGYHAIFCLSEWHKGFVHHLYAIQNNYKLPPIITTRNGIDPKRFSPNATIFKEENRLIYSSSPDRGLEVLLAFLPDIIAEVPDTVLHIYYGMKTWQSMIEAAVNEAKDEKGKRLAEHQLQRVAIIKRAIQEFSSKGWVVNHDRVSQDELAKAFMASKIWAYPTFFTETSCITAMEAQAAACVPVATHLAALPETVHHGFLFKPPVDSNEYRKAFVNRVVTLLKNENYRHDVAQSGRRWALANQTWAGVSDEWQKIFQEMLP